MLVLEKERSAERLHLETAARGMGFGPAEGWDLLEEGGALGKFSASAESALRTAWFFNHERPERQENGAALQALLARVRAHLASRLEPSLAGVARRFDPALHGAVYEALSRDETGRLRQLADSCPGALAFALHHARMQGESARGEALAFRGAVVSGKPLNAALRALLEGWATHVRRVRHFPGEVRALNAQRWLLRHAVASIPGRQLWLPPPRVFIPEDVPQEPEAQRRWFEVMKGSAVATGVHHNLSPEELQSWLGWLSRHAVEVHGCGVAVESLEFAILASNARPPRSRPVASVVAFTREFMAREAELEARWEREDRLGCDGLYPGVMPEEPGQFDLYEDLSLPWPERLASVAAAHPGAVVKGEDGALDVRLPNPFPGCSEERLGVRPLLLASELHAEGERMRHCVATYLGGAVRGEDFLFHADAAGAPLTVHVSGPVRSPRLVTFLGPRNEEPTQAQSALVWEWWNRVRSSPCP